MEKKITTKYNNFTRKCKEEIGEKLLEILKGDIDEENKKKLEECLQYVYDYDTNIFNTGDFQKKKRLRNVVKCDERCRAFRANGEQCTRRRKNDKYCGTHMKGLPHGHIVHENKKEKIKNIKVWEEEINGISYYIDNNNNVYDTYDILEGKSNPSIINTYESVYDSHTKKNIFTLVN